MKSTQLKLSTLLHIGTLVLITIFSFNCTSKNSLHGVPDQNLKKIPIDDPQKPAPPALFNVSEIVDPAEVAQISGGPFTSQAEIWVKPMDSNSLTPEMRADRISVSEALIQFRLPQLPFKGLWSVRVYEQGVWSKTLYINQIRVTHSTHKSVSYGDTFEIFGRNFQIDPNQPLKAELLDLDSHQTLPLTVVTADLFSAKIKISSYFDYKRNWTLRLKNTAATESSVDIDPKFLPTFVAQGADDRLGLGVGWARAITYDQNVWNLVTGIGPGGKTLNKKADPSGSQNSFDAIQEALITIMNEGGGVAYLPAGNYKMTLDPQKVWIRIPPRTILRGAGQSQTKITFGNAANPENYWALRFDCPLTSCNPGPSGIMDLSLINNVYKYLDYNKTKNSGIGAQDERSKQIFISSVNYKMGTYDSIGFDRVEEFLIKDSFFDNPLSPWSTFNFTRTKYGVITNTHFEYFRGRFDVAMSSHLFMENNEIIRNVAMQPNMAIYPHNQCCSGGIEQFLNDTSVYKNNKIAIINGYNYPGMNDGESFNAEVHTYNFTQIGTVSSASAITITDTLKNWDTSDIYPTEENGKANPDASLVHLDGTLVPFLPRSIQTPVIAITSGVGKGQWRTIVSNTKNSITIDRPWDILPTSGSGYKVFAWGTTRTYILNNTIEGGQMGILIYSGGYDNVASGNQVNNSGRIAFVGDDLYFEDNGFVNPCRYMYPPGHPLHNNLGMSNVWLTLGKCYRQAPLWNNLIYNNTVSDTTSRQVAAVEFNLQTFQNLNDYRWSQPIINGISLYLNEAKKNTIVAWSPRNLTEIDTAKENPPFMYSGTRFNSTERFYVTVASSAKETSNRINNEGILGIIFSGNQLINHDQSEPAYIASLGTSQIWVDGVQKPNLNFCVKSPLFTQLPLGESISIEVKDNTRFNDYYQTTCNQGHCDDLFLRKDIASQKNLIPVNGRVDLTDYAALMLTQYLRRPVLQGGIDPWFSFVDNTQTYDLVLSSPSLGQRTFKGIKNSDLNDPNKCAILN